jgi:hypothetical protein
LEVAYPSSAESRGVASSPGSGEGSAEGGSSDLSSPEGELLIVQHYAEGSGSGRGVLTPSPGGEEDDGVSEVEIEMGRAERGRAVEVLRKTESEGTLGSSHGSSGSLGGGGREGASASRR